MTSPLLPSLKADRCCLYAQAISDCGTDSPGEHVLVIGLTPPDQQRHRLLSLLPLTYSGQNTDAGDFNGFQLTVESGGGKFQGAEGLSPLSPNRAPPSWGAKFGVTTGTSPFSVTGNAFYSLLGTISQDGNGPKSLVWPQRARSRRHIADVQTSASGAARRDRG